MFDCNSSVCKQTVLGTISRCLFEAVFDELNDCSLAASKGLHSSVRSWSTVSLQTFRLMSMSDRHTWIKVVGTQASNREPFKLLYFNANLCRKLRQLAQSNKVFWK